MNERNQYLSIGEKFVEIDEKYSVDPELQYKVVHTWIDWSGLIL